MRSSKWIAWIGCVAASAIVIGVASIQATEPKLPSAETVLDAYVEATGGRAAYDRVTNRVAKGKMTLVGQGIALDLTFYFARPNKVYTVIESDATGRIEKGTDGLVVWESSDMMGPQIKEGQERTDFLREAYLDKFVHWREIYEGAECVGSEMIADKPSYKVVLRPKQGRPQTLYFDEQSELLVKVELTVENAMGVIPVKTSFGNYREIDGLLLPHETRLEIMGQERVMITDSIEHNVELPEDRFDLPEDIRTLIDGEAGDEQNVG